MFKYSLEASVVRSICELDHHRGSKGQEGLGRILIKDRLGLVEGPVRSDGSVEGGLGGVDWLR